MDVLPLFPEITRRFIAERREQSMHRCIAHVEKVIRDGGMRTCDASIVAGMGALSESFLTRFVVGKGERLAIGVGCHGSDFDFTALSPESEGADSVKLCVRSWEYKEPSWRPIFSSRSSVISAMSRFRGSPGMRSMIHHGRSSFSKSGPSTKYIKT